MSIDLISIPCPRQEERQFLEMVMHWATKSRPSVFSRLVPNILIKYIAVESSRVLPLSLIQISIS
jgi:hypothetical protein